MIAIMLAPSINKSSYVPLGLSRCSIKLGISPSHTHTHTYAQSTY